ncbi:MAG: hypothetical protein QGI33_07770 [Candidatus Brocadiia bacterium]|jgi:uncharacterized membrane protein|nr:hypothetical protein [Candidatus Brocadiia bacterium]
MFIDYVPLMLVNMVAGLALLALAVARGLGQEGQEKWAPGFAMTGLGGALILPVIGLRRNLVFRILAVLALGGAALIWFITASGAYVAHLVTFAEWTPLIMR